MRLGNWRGAAAALGLVGALASSASAGGFHHSIPRLTPAMDYRTGEQYYAPPIPYGHYVGKQYGAHLYGAVATVPATAKGFLHGHLGKLFHLGKKHQGGCGADGCGAEGCSVGYGADGSAFVGPGGDSFGSPLGPVPGGGFGGDVHGPIQGGVIGPAGQAGAVPTPISPQYLPSIGNGQSRADEPKTHDDRAIRQVALLQDGQGGLPQGQFLPGQALSPQGAFPQGQIPGGAFGGPQSFGPELGQPGLAGGSLPYGAQGGYPGESLGGADCGADMGAGGGCGHCGGGGCGMCAGLKGHIHGLMGLPHSVLGKAHGLLGSVLHPHAGKIEYFVGPGGPVPITPGYVPYVVPTRSPRDYFAFPPFSDLTP